MRIRVLELPGDQFLLVVDGIPEGDPRYTNELWGDVSTTLGKRLVGFGGIITLNDKVEL